MLSTRRCVLGSVVLAAALSVAACSAASQPKTTASAPGIASPIASKTSAPQAFTVPPKVRLPRKSPRVAAHLTVRQLCKAIIGATGVSYHINRVIPNPQSGGCAVDAQGDNPDGTYGSYSVGLQVVRTRFPVFSYKSERQNSASTGGRLDALTSWAYVVKVNRGLYNAAWLSGNALVSLQVEEVGDPYLAQPTFTIRRLAATLAG